MVDVRRPHGLTHQRLVPVALCGTGSMVGIPGHWSDESRVGGCSRTLATCSTTAQTPHSGTGGGTHIPHDASHALRDDPPATGVQHYAWPAICKHFNLDPAKLCGPVIVARTGFPEGNCCFGHPLGSPLHKSPTVASKPFAIADHHTKLKELGLVGTKSELVAMVEAKGTPSGTPKKIGQALVYPAPHFG